MTQNLKQNIPAIIVMIFLFGMIAFVTNLASPMGDILKHQFTISNLEGTLGVFAIFIAYAIMGYPAGRILDKHGYKKTALLAISIGFVGVGIQAFSGVAESFGIYLLGAFVAGFSMCLLNTVVNPMLNKLGGGGNKGNQLIQIGGVFSSISGTSVIILTGLLIPSIAQAQISDVFPLMFAALAIFAVAFVIISLARIPENSRGIPAGVYPEQERGTGMTAEVAKSPLAYRHFVLGAIGVFVYVGIEVGIPNVLNKWLQNPTLNVLGAVNAEAVAASVAATYWFLMLIGRFVGIAVASKVSAKAMLTFTACLGLILTLSAIFFATSSAMVSMPVFKNEAYALFGFANVPISAVFLVCLGLCTSVMWGGIFNLAVEGLGKQTEKASGIFMMMVCGGGILPLLQNGIVDMTGGMGFLTSYWVVVAGLLYLLYYALIGCKNVNVELQKV